MFSRRRSKKKRIIYKYIKKYFIYEPVVFNILRIKEIKLLLCI